jgi:hypothetical protein
MSQYQVHTCLIWDKKSALDPNNNTMTSLLLCFFTFKTIHHQYQVGIIFCLKRSNIISTNLVCSKTHSLPAPYLHAPQQWFLPWYQCRCWLTQGTSSRHYWQASVFKRDVQTIYVEICINLWWPSISWWLWKTWRINKLACNSLLLIILFSSWYLLRITWKKIENFVNFFISANVFLQ